MLFFKFFLQFFKNVLEQKWQRQDKWSKWKLGRAYSCPTSDLLSEMKLAEEDSSDEDEVFEEMNNLTKRDINMAQTGLQLTYLGSLKVKSLLDNNLILPLPQLKPFCHSILLI